MILGCRAHTPPLALEKRSKIANRKFDGEAGFDATKKMVENQTDQPGRIVEQQIAIQRDWIKQAAVLKAHTHHLQL